MDFQRPLGVVTPTLDGDVLRQAKLYSLNRGHLAAPYIQQLTTLRSELVERLRSFVEAWEVAPFAVFLFGSAARGDAGPNSDLDLFVVRPEVLETDDSRWQEQLAELEKEATVWTGNEARVVEYRRRDLADPDVDKLAREVLKEGVPIFGTRPRLRLQMDKYKP